MSVTPTELPVPGPEEPFFAPVGANDRIDLGGSGDTDAVVRTVHGKTVIDQVGFASSIDAMNKGIERIEELIGTGGIKVKRLEDGKLVDSVSTKLRSDEEIVKLVKGFYNGVGPTFISEPIDGYVYVSRVPSLKDRIDAEGEGNEQPGTVDDKLWTQNLSLVLHALYGRIPEGRRDQIQLIRAMPSEPNNWLSFLEQRAATVAAILNDRNPTAMADTIHPLISAWFSWFGEVTPTGDELKKYRALVDSGTSS